MALQPWPQGSLRPSPIIVWELEGGGVAQLDGATLTGKLRNRATSATRAIAGTLTVTNGAAGEFRWDLDAADVATAGHFDVQFTASFAAGASPARTFVERWTVVEALT
jgi:TRAP-type mannitol/chloroaromatic compound transport system substrate-binding protein